MKFEPAQKNKTPEPYVKYECPIPAQKITKKNIHFVDVVACPLWCLHMTNEPAHEHIHTTEP
jgi:hypothetical protein